MICDTVEELTPIIGTRPACRTLGASHATIYRRRRPPSAGRPSRGQRPPGRCLKAERGAVLDTLHSERFVDTSPAQVHATLLDEGRYLASERTMYRLLAAKHDGVRERRDQLTHPAYAKPELLALPPQPALVLGHHQAPRAGEVDVLPPLRDPRHLQPLRRRLARAAPRAGPIAEPLIAHTIAQHHIARGQLTLHADRGTPMRSKPVASLLVDLHVTKTHSRPYTSTDNPYSESHFKTLKYRPAFPARFNSIEHARALCRAFFAWYNNEHRHTGISLMTPPSVHYGRATHVHANQQPRPQRSLRAHARTVHQPRTDSATGPDRRVDQQADDQGGRSLITDTKCLTGLDRLRVLSLCA